VSGAREPTADAREERISDLVPIAQGRVSVRVGGRVVCRVPAQVVSALRLRVGDPWSQSVSDGVRERVGLWRARRDAERLIARRAVSRAELLARLEGRGHPTDVGARVAEDLAAVGLIDDRRLAKEVIQWRLQARPAGRALLEQMLIRRGIGEDDARDASDEALADRPPGSGATDAAEKWWGARPRGEPHAAARRLAGFLLRRGFDDEEVRDAVRTISGIELDQP